MASTVETDMPKHLFYHAFLCYAYEDRKWVEKLVSVLESSPFNLRCCNHNRDFEAGQTTADNIEKHVKASKKFILVITPSFNESKWCKHERDLILSLSMSEKQRTVIPVLLAKCNVPFSLQLLTYVEASWNFEEYWFNKILKALDISELSCSVCLPEGKQRIARTRCSVCKAAFCSDCNVQHGRMPISKDHQTTGLPRNYEEETKETVFENHVKFQNSRYKIVIWDKSDTNTQIRKRNVKAAVNEDGAVTEDLDEVSGRSDNSSFEERFEQLIARVDALERKTNTGTSDEVDGYAHTEDETFPILEMSHNRLITPKGRVSSVGRTVSLPDGPFSFTDLQKPAVTIQPMSSDSDDG